LAIEGYTQPPRGFAPFAAERDSLGFQEHSLWPGGIILAPGFFVYHQPPKTTWFWGINTQPLRGFYFYLFKFFGGLTRKPADKFGELTTKYWQDQGFGSQLSNIWESDGQSPKNFITKNTLLHSFSQIYT
jgi:hypothetical protein